MKQPPPKRIVPKRRAGINNPAAAFWRGERCESIVAHRVEEYQKLVRRKKHAAAWKRATKSKKATCSVCGKHHTKCKGRISARILEQQDA